MQIIRKGKYLYPVHKTLSLTDRVAMYGRTPGNYSQMKIPAIKVRKSRVVKHVHGPCITIK